MKFHSCFQEIPISLAPFGGDNDDSGDNGGQPNPEDSQEDSGKGGAGKKAPETPSDDDNGDDEFEGYSPKELRRIARDNAAAKKTAEAERNAYKEKVDEQERKSRTDEENLKNDLTEAKQRISTLVATNAKLAITNAIICDTRYEWYNPEIVAQQLNSEIVKVNDNGNVEGLKKELDRVSKEHAYLLKTKGQQGSSKPTGFQPGQGGSASSGSTGSPDVKELAKTYPALASRM